MVRDTVAPARPRAAGSSSTPSTSSTATGPTRTTRWRWSAPRPRPGADVVALCDTNGGMLPSELATSSPRWSTRTGARLGIHCHDDTGCAVANTLAAVEAGATHVQGTANGYGERAGNADLFSVVAGLELKMDRQVLPDGLPGRDDPGRARDRRGGQLAPDTHQPYVGRAAFAHKAGLHASAIKVDPISTSTSTRRWSATTCGCSSPRWPGRASIELKGRELGFDLSGDRTSSAGSSTGSRSWRPTATPSRPPTPRSSCCCATRSTAGARRRTSTSSPGG